ncbi:PREDICTED: interferon-induced transmembrane protein 3-like [Elephantulus edwardii]|uniref:interferon-induced transmembrane protein 3-like n=1 Tax=Elephantulus edwardii TaxID=28737 RepID=UPI0003F06C9F|nr:PREDICTED: interferon-induced transmembrane protein 3-like [Elephantulus edwardii]
MNRAAQPLFTRAATGLPPPYEVLKEEQEVVLGESLGPEPLGPAPVRSTVINIRSDIAVPDHVVWSLFNTLFLNCCCLGLAAFAYSVKSRDRKMVGDVIGAQSYASTAKCLNIFALVLSLLVIVLFIILIATGTVMSLQAAAEMIKNHPGY